MDFKRYAEIVEKADGEIGVPSNFRDSMMFIMVQKAIEAMEEQEFLGLCAVLKTKFK